MYLVIGLFMMVKNKILVQYSAAQGCSISLHILFHCKPSVIILKVKKLCRNFNLFYEYNRS